MYLGTWRLWKDWLSEGAFVFLGTAVPIAVFVICWGRDESWFRLAGMIFQLAGTGTVLLNIAGSLSQFGMPGIRRSVIAYMARIPFRKRVAFAQMNGVTSDAEFGWLIASSITPPKDGSVEALREATEKNIKALQDHLGSIFQHLTVKHDGLVKKMQAERAELETRIKSVRGDLVKTATGGVAIIWVGTWWILMGTLMATATTELVKFAS